MQPNRYIRANLLAFAIPAALLGGALGSQYIGGLYPCEMCYWQRWPHYAALAIALVAFWLKPPMKPVLIALAGLVILTSGAIGIFHAGVEYHWWQGITACSAGSAGVSLQDLLRAPIISCDAAQWTLFDISLAGFNALFSIPGGLAVLALVKRAS